MVRLLGSGSLSKSSSLTMTCWSLAYSYPRTVSPHSTSRSQAGHQRSCLSRLLHSRWRRRNEMSLLSVAVNSFTGMLTIPKLIRPFHIDLGMTAPFPALRRFREECIYDTGFAPAYKHDRLSVGCTGLRGGAARFVDSRRRRVLDFPARAIETPDQPEGATSFVCLHLARA